MAKVDKTRLKARMLELEQDELDHAIEHYDSFLKASRLDRREAHDRDEYALSRMNADLAASFDHPVHDHQAKLDVISAMDFAPCDTVQKGAVISFGGRHFVVSVSTRQFDLEGQTFMGISTESPIYKKLADLSEGDSIEHQGHDITLDEVY